MYLCIFFRPRDEKCKLLLRFWMEEWKPIHKIHILLSTGLQINTRKFWGQAPLISLYIQITDETLSKLKHSFHVFQKCIKTNTILCSDSSLPLGQRQKHPKEARQSKKEWKKSLMFLCFRAHIQPDSINLLQKRRFNKRLIWKQIINNKRKFKFKATIL